LFETDTFAGLVNGFYGSIFDFAGIQDSRTLILEIFVYIGLVFTLLTIPFIEMLRRELIAHKITIDLGGKTENDA